MNKEEIIRKEAREFFFEKITVFRYSGEPVDDIHEIKDRLNDFYTDDNKSIFLDEIQIVINKELERKRKQQLDFTIDQDLNFEVKVETLLFYIKQELETLPMIVHQKFNSHNKATRKKVFISYCHADDEQFKDVQRHFKPFLNSIDYWDDTRIQPGQKWKDEIRKAISETKVAIILLSTDYMGSDFIATDELPPLLNAAEKEGAIVLIVIIKPCLFEEFDQLNKYQALNSPSKPVIKMDYTEKEELYVNLVKQTRKHLKE